MTLLGNNQKIKLVRVINFPKVLEPGTLYLSEEFETATHLCPCGCNRKVITPLGPTDWSFTERNGQATLYPSIGNWQFPCKSHYWIKDGFIDWSNQWTEEEIKVGQKAVEEIKLRYYENPKKEKRKGSLFRRFINLLLGRR